MVKDLIEHPVSRDVYVVNDENKLLGAIFMVHVLEKIFPKEFESDMSFVADMDLVTTCLANTAGEMMQGISNGFVKDEDLIFDVFHKMRNHNVTQLPIVDANRKVTGIIHIDHLLKAGFRNRTGV